MAGGPEHSTTGGTTAGVQAIDAAWEQGLASALRGRYTLLGELGRGGMGIVYRARDEKHDRLVALKVLTPVIGKLVGPERFLREIRLAARLRHPHIITLFDSGEADGQLYYVMPCIDGGSLRARLTEEGRLEVGEALRFAIDIAHALDCAHRRGVVHRDIKPENILLDDGHVLVTDFGIAGPVGETVMDRLTTTDLVIGTPQYMSPEQALGGRDLDGRTDLYSLGCVTYEMLLGRPFLTDAEGRTDYLRRYVERGVELHHRRPDIPESVDAVLARALACQPHERFTTAGEFASSLEREIARLERWPGRRSGGTQRPLPPALVGRDDEITQLKSLLELSQIVTIVGPGGIGKTRLARYVAALRAGRFEDGSEEVLAEDITSADVLISAIGERFGLALVGPADPLHQIADGLASKDVLLVIDGFDRLVPHAKVLTELTQRAAGLRLLLTSRERLNVADERLLELHGLPVPETSSPSDAVRSPAVQLFLERARRLAPHFEPSATELADIAEITRLVHGLPLGIEMAASLFRLLSTSELLAELSRGLDALTSPRRDAADRHRSLRAVFEFSWSMLEPGEREVATGLTTFVGGFEREAALQVADAKLPVLATLIDKSLVHKVGDHRYELYPLFRQYASEWAGAESIVEAAGRRHSQYFARAASRAAQHIGRAGHAQALRDVAEDILNFRAAWEWAVTHRATGELSRLIGLLQFYELRGWLRDGVAATTAVLEMELPDDRLHAELRTLRGRFFLVLAELDRAREDAEEALAIARRHGSPATIAPSLRLLGQLALRHGRYEEAMTLATEAADLLRSDAPTDDLALVTNDVGLALQAFGRKPEAERAFRESLALCRSLDYQWGEARVLNNLAALIDGPDAHADAYDLFEQALTLSRKLGDERLVAIGLCNLGLCSYFMGETTRARQHLSDSARIARRIGSRHDLATALSCLAMIATASDELEEAERLLHEAISEALAIKAMQIVTGVVVDLARLLLRRGAHEQAIQLLQIVRVHPATQHADRVQADELLGQQDTVGDGMAPKLGGSLELDTALAYLAVGAGAPPR